MSNWIEKAATIISANSDNAIWASEVMDIIESHAPVIDAEKLVKAIRRMECDKYGGYPHVREDELRKELLAVITDSIDLSITWVDGKSRWGIFEAEVVENKYQDGVTAVLSVNEDTERLFKYTTFPTQELAQAACVDALKRIVTGGKDA